MEMLSSLPKEIEEYVIPPEESCSLCGAPLKVIGKEIVRTQVEFQPAKLVVKQIVRQVPKCTQCGTKNSSNPKDHFQKASVPQKVLPHSLATHSLVSHIMYQKFFLGIPLSRQESDFFRMGLLLHRSTMAHWVICCSQEWLEPIYWCIHEALVRHDILHMDETRIQWNGGRCHSRGSDRVLGNFLQALPYRNGKGTCLLCIWQCPFPCELRLCVLGTGKPYLHKRRGTGQSICISEVS